MSLLLEALKKAEKAKEEAQKRAQEGGGVPEASGELRLADEAPESATEPRVITRDELPPITAPLDIQSEDIARTGDSGLSLQDEPRPTPPPAPSTLARAEAPAAQRAAARNAFEAKVREPNPRLPFFITMGMLGAACAGTVIYFWIQLSPRPSLYVTDPKPQQEVVVAPAPATTSSAPTTSSGPSTSGAIPGLPQTAATSTPAVSPAVAPTPPATASTPATPTPAPATSAAPSAAPRPATLRRPAAPSRPRQRAAADAAPTPASAPIRASVAHTRPTPRIHPQVAAGYAAYQAGDMDRARRDYLGALEDEPDNRDALLGMAAVETRLQRPAAAEVLYRRLLSADPRDPHAQAGLLGLRTGQVSPVGAESRLKALIAEDARESVLFFSLGNQFAQQGRWAEASQAYARAAAMDPDNPDFAYNYGVSLEHGREPVSALQQYRRALILSLKRTASFDPAVAESRVQALSR